MRGGGRIEWIDYAKGFAMLLVIIGHTINHPVIRGLIYSFHMPLFFILSCVTFRFSKNTYEWKSRIFKSVRTLILPAFILFILNFIYYFICQLIQNPSLFGIVKLIAKQMLAIFFASGSANAPEGYPLPVPPLGIPWFLVVLFLSKTIFDYLHLCICDLRILGLISCVCSIIGVVLGKIFWLPQSFDIVLAILPFFFFTMVVKGTGALRFSAVKLCVSFTTWLLLFGVIFIASDNYLQLAPREYPLFPLCYICAVAGSLFVIWASMKLSSIKCLSFVTFIGRYSLFALMIHTLDHTFSFAWELSTNEFINCIIRLLLNVMLLYIFVWFRHSIEKNRNQAICH